MKNKGISRLLLVLSVIAAGAPSRGSQTEPPLRILSITPRGPDVPPGRQIVIQFDRKVVPVGRMERRAGEIPVTIVPPLACEWRWLDTNSLACQLGEADAFRPATQYKVTVRPGIRTESGATLAAPVENEFETERPKVTSTYFDRWLGPGMPQIQVVFNQRVSAPSVTSHLYFEVGAGKRFPVYASLANPEAAESERHWLVRSLGSLPLESMAYLTLDAGLASLEGPLPSLESKPVVEVYTFPAHVFLGINCGDGKGTRFRIPASAPLSGRRCNPMEPVELVFASPVIKEILEANLTVEPDLAGGREDFNPWDSVYGYTALHQPRNWGSDGYGTRLPKLLRARTEYRVRASGSALLDEFGRPLAEDLDFVFSTMDRPPHLALTHPISTLEKDVDTRVPAVVTNLDSLHLEIEAMTADGVQNRNETIQLPDVLNVAYRHPLPTREWLFGRSGALYANVRTHPQTEEEKAYVPRIFSQVTPFAVHTKLAHQNTAVWVTDMKTGLPVEGASVSIYRAAPAVALREREAVSRTTTDSTGVALLPGQKDLNPSLATARWDNLLYPDVGEMFFVSVEKDGDLALAPLSSDFSVYVEGTNNTWVPTFSRTRYGHVRAWGTTAQGVYRLGDTVQYKIYVRDQSNEHFVKAPPETYHLQVYDPMDKMVHEETSLTLSPFGALDGEFRVAESGAVGWYRFQLQSSFHNEPWEPLRVLVADFTPAPFRVTTDLDGERYEPGEEIHVSTSAKLHSGGPYADADSRITVNITPTSVSSENPKAAGFWFGYGFGETVTVHQSESPVDAEGELETEVPVLDQSFPRGRISIESAVRDDRGKYVAGRATAEYVGRDRFVGIHSDGWILQAGEAAEVEAIVIDRADEVARGTDVTLRIEYRETTASRVKGAGNAYITQYNYQWVDVATCEEASGPEPLRCGFTPEKPGYYRYTAAIADTKGRAYEVSNGQWAAGKGQVLWEESPGHRLDIEPEKKEYRVGETARFLVRNPFPGAKALVTIERYGVQRHWLETFEESTAVIEVPVLEDHVPGFYLSAVVTSPRVEAAPSEDDVDLGKPAFRMGYVQVPVVDPAKEITVDVRPEKDLYKPQDKVKVVLKARPRLWASTSPPPMELAVAVLDEAVFDLIGGGDQYFDPYRGFYSLEPLDVENFNLLTRLIGIQKFEKKGANPGGDGGGGPDLRTLFKFVSYWNPAIVPDAEGRATIEFEVPDNLTGWRILTMAVTPEDRMGLGVGNFKVNRPTEIRPALPNQVTEDDRFDARFTVMNRTEEIRTLTVTAEVSGMAESRGLQAQTIEAEPYQRYDVSFPVRATGVGEMVFTLRASDLVDGDALRLPLPVGRREALEVAATYGTTIDPNTLETFLFPENMRTDVGRVSVVSSPTVLGNLEGAFDYLRSYPYGCWEQKLTKAVMASHFASLRDYIRKDFDWPGHESLPEATLALAANYQTGTGAMSYYGTYDEPYLSAYTALAFHWLRERGHTIPAAVESRLQDYLRQFLRTDVFPDFYSRGMSSTVRAVALAALALEGALEKEDLERYRPHTNDMDLFGKAHFLMAANALGVGAREVEDAILARSNRSGGKIVFSESVDDGYPRILYSAERTQCAVLSALTRGSSRPEGDFPFELTRTITQSRGRRDRWENTQENVFCMNSLIDYSKLYESETPNFTLRTYFDSESLGEAKFDDRRDPPVDHERSLRPRDPGKSGQLRISKLGPGRLYYAARLFYSPKDLKAEPVNAGVEIRREYSVQRGGAWVLLQEPMRIRSGELVKVDLFVSLPAPRNFLVVDDPVPGGLEPVNRDLATASTVDADQAEFEGASDSFWFTRDDWFYYGYSRWSFYHRELRHDAVRFYSEWLPGGNYHLSYAAQAIAPGEFRVLPVHAEEMYDPDVFGQGVPGTLAVEERQ